MSHTNKGNKARVIVVVESGWVFMAERMYEDADRYELSEASVIRRWGTTAGLGELAVRGPTPETVFDFCGNPIVPRNKILFIIPCTY
jgi:hypothetical protein